MKKSIVILVTTTVIATSLFGAPAKKAPEQVAVEKSVLMSPKEARVLTMQALENNYVSNKVSCDKALEYSNSMIERASANGNLSEKLHFSVKNYGEEKSNGISMSTHCPALTIDYLFNKSGYSVQHEVNNYGNLTGTFVISW